MHEDQAMVLGILISVLGGVSAPSKKRAYVSLGLVGVMGTWSVRWTGGLVQRQL